MNALFAVAIVILILFLLAVYSLFSARASLKGRPKWVLYLLGVCFAVGFLCIAVSNEPAIVYTGIALVIPALCGIIVFAYVSSRAQASPSQSDTHTAIRFYRALKNSSAKIKCCYGACAAFGFFCLIGMCGCDAGYYHFLRLFALFAFGITILAFGRETGTFFTPVTLIAGTLAIVFNPIVPIYSDKVTWQVIDLISAVVSFCLSIYIVKKSARSAQ